MPPINRQHVDAEGRLQGGVLEEIVDENLWVAVPLQFNDHAGVLVGFITNITDALEDFLVDEFGDAPDKLCAVYTKRNFRNDNILTTAFDFFGREASRARAPIRDRFRSKT